MTRFFRRGLTALLTLIFLFSAGCSSETIVDEDAVNDPANLDIVTIAAVGDIFMSDEVIEQANLHNGSYDFLPTMNGVFAAVSNADLTFGNFEGNFNGSPYGPHHGSYPDELCSTLKNAGFDILQTANSFSLTAGMTGLKQTKSLIDGMGMVSLGTYADSADKADSQVRVFDVNGIRVAFIAFTKSINGMTIPEGTDSCVDLLYTDYDGDFNYVDTEGILAVLDTAKAKNPDVIIAGLHWGSENVTTVTTTQSEISDLLFQNGVDAILGTHSHVVSSVEKRQIILEDGSRKNVVLAYSLGDFCEVGPGDCNVTPILKMDFAKNRITGKVSLNKLYFTTVASVDLGEEAPLRYSIFDADNAIELYESNYYDRISSSLYDKLIEQRQALADKMGIQIG